jgi:hypothetical protein
MVPELRFFLRKKIEDYPVSITTVVRMFDIKTIPEASF